MTFLILFFLFFNVICHLCFSFCVLRTVYMRFSHSLFSKVILTLEMDSWRNSHSPCVFITSRENCVAREELEKGESLISSTVLRNDRKNERNVSEFKQLWKQEKTHQNTHPPSPQWLAEPMVMLHFCVSKGNLWTSILQVLTILMSSSEVIVPS